MPIPEDTIDKVRLSNNIESVVREYLPDLKRAGRNWKACCPFHNEKIPSFIVSSEKGIFRCFGCNVAGDVFKFVMLADNISWIEAVKKLAEKANIVIQETKQDVMRTSEKAKLFAILENSAVFYHRGLREKTTSAKKAREYLEKRGITNETVNKFKMGFSSKGQFLRWALKKGYTTTDLLKAGLITKTEQGFFFEYMSERIVFPIFNLEGKIVAFGGRSITNQEPKYLNTPETSVYSKSSNLYGLFQTLPELRKERKTIVLEGYMDVVIPQQFGISGAVAPLGTAFTQNHAKLIARYSDSVTLLFDSDNAGRIATQRALEILVENGIETKVSALPENVDADEYLNQHGKENFFKLIENSSNSAIDFMIARLYRDSLLYGKKNSPEIKAKAIYSLLDFVAKSSSAIIQRDWIKDIAQYLNVDEEAVWNEFKKKQKRKHKGHAGNDTKSLIPYFVENKKVPMSLEENLLNIVLSNRDYVKRVDSSCLRDERCARVFSLVVSGLSDVKILNALPQENRNWFSELTLNAIKYNDIEEAFEIILKDIKLDMLEKKRQQLEKEVLLMSDGKKEKNAKVIDKYNELTTFLKGSRK
ncbi:MAG: DNA primase [Endomicrobium sp.]|jgi:DNA primase|nr:DNA primase [Endomicrobium sp.]